LKEIRRELEQSKTELEKRVEERTAELSTAKEVAELAARAKGEFLATMSHELRTPLNAILGFSEMIAQAALGPVDQRYRDYGTHIVSSGQHLLSLVNDVLDLSKLKSGKFEIHVEQVDIGKILHTCKEMVIGLAKEADISLRIKPDADLRPVWVDPLRVKQIMVNLLSNAIKFTEAGGWVNVSAKMGAKGDAIIEVEDNGIGMDLQGIKRALEPFGQIERSTNHSQGGTGLGLPVVKHLAVLHGGALDIVSAPGTGTRVTVRLPTVAPVKKAIAS
jgi:signal transduction histidine kinase